jgi:chromosome segregation ATPase
VDGGGIVNIDTGVISVVLAVATFILGRLSNANKKGETDGELKADIKHIKETQMELKDDIRLYGENYTEVRAELEKIKGRLAKLEEIVNIYHGKGIV